ncbi:MAG: serine/threonine-protein kinase [Polyangiales bacterium]
MGGTPYSDEFGLVGTAIDGKYAVEAVAAAGGFGVVYRGRHLVLGSAVALKVLRVPPELGEGARRAFVQMFLNEARIVAALTHPAVVRAVDFGAVAYAPGLDAPWMALDWIDGATLARDLDARRGRGGRSPAEALSLLGPVAEALAEAHEAGVAHRDVKPGNVMLPHARGRRGVEARLLDFGIAKVMGGDETATSGQTLTHSALPAFSPRYAAPEQVSRMRSGPWTDVHALGLLFTEVLTDRAPYDGDKLQLTAQAMASARPTPGRFGVDVGPWESVLARALALHPNDRYPDARALLDALEATAAEADRAWTAARDEPTRERAAPAVAPVQAPAPQGAGTISAVVLPDAPPATPKGRRAAVAVAVVAGAVVAAATAFVLGRAPAPTARVAGALRAAAVPARAEPAVTVAPAAVQVVADAAPVVPVVVPVAPAVAARGAPVARATPLARPARRGTTSRTPGLLPEPPLPSRADERPPLE